MCAIRKQKESGIMRYISVCSGIEAATVAWHSLGWEPVAFSEVSPFPCAVLAHHYPNVPNLGDMTKIEGNDYHGTVDLLVGGTPCQDFSIAGKRTGLVGERGGLALAYLSILEAIRPRWVVWENVPGVLSVNGGRDFGTFIGGLAQRGYGFAYRVLDAQYFGVPQRRRRVFLVGYFGDWRPAAAVLFEPQSMCRDTPPSRKKREDIAGTFTACAYSGGAGGRPEGAAAGHFLPYVTHHGTHQGGKVFALRTDQTGSNGLGVKQGCSYTLDGANGQAIAFHGSQDPSVSGDVTHSLGRNQGRETCIALFESWGKETHVRRLTPRECERLQGFPDDYTVVQYRGREASDTARYKALGNSMAVPVMQWIGKRICVQQHSVA